MMKVLFFNILNASLYGSIVIMAVLALRLALKKAPRAAFCLLWLMAGIRLVLPFTIESRMSLQPDVPEFAQVQQEEIWGDRAGDLTLTAPPDQIMDAQTPALPQQTDGQEAPLPEDAQVFVSDDAVTDHKQHTVDYGAAAAWIWAAGMAALLVCSAWSYWKLRYHVREAVRQADGSWECSGLDTAFVLGLFRPRIYLPGGLSDRDRELILAHERAHIARRDHWIKPVGYLVLMLHWFNPLVWVAYACLCRDIEMACDERVVRSMDVAARKDYSRALLSCSSRRMGIAACPVAFGEVGVKQRIRSVLNYRKPGFWVMVAAVVAVVFVVVCLMTSPEQEFVGVEIPSLSYSESEQTYRLTERFSPMVKLAEKTEGYASDYANYHFETTISNEGRDACVFYSDRILDRFQLTIKPDIIVLADYDGAWIDQTSGTKFYIGGDFDSVDYGAKLITLLCGGYANYGAAYGYADYIAVEEGWKQENKRMLRLTAQDARDMNWLCFREEFVSKEDIEANQTAAARFAWDMIAQIGETGYQQLLIQSGSTETVSAFNIALSSWYADQGLEYTPSEILYAIGGSYHDYLVKCRYATFYLPKDWDNGFDSPATMDEKFLHHRYGQVKLCFEINASQMGDFQKTMGFDQYDNDLTVEFMEGSISQTRTVERLIRINSIEDLPMQYVYWISLNPMRMRNLGDVGVVGSSIYVGMADYIATTSANVYKAEWLRHCAETGMQPSLYQEGNWNQLFIQMMEGQTDPAVIQRTRWDFGTYYFDDYYDKPGNGVATSFLWYLIDKYGYHAMFDYVYETGREPIYLDMIAERDAWIAYLEKTYKDYPKYSDYEAACSALNCTDPNCTDVTHNHYGIACTVEHCDNPAHGHGDHDHH